MGLDQAVYRMTSETADVLRKWDASDKEGPFPDVEMDALWNGRKENHIQQFMEGEVGDVQNCAYLFLEREDIERLVDRLKRVDADHSLAGAVLPTQDGFFFGSTDYDEWYFSDVKEELKFFTEILEEWDDEQAYAYWAWW